jgi:hypothetical protein
MALSLAERLEHNSIPEPNSGCLLWLGRVNDDGYGLFGRPGRRAHRVAWEAHNGPIPDAMDVLHKCDVRSCINDDHLFLGTQADNMADKVAKGRHVSLPGERHGRAKLTTLQVAALRADGRSHSILARLYGISKGNVSMIKAGKRWAASHGK